ncbi:MAG TPA: imelysin family protein [Acidimicrobiia bacterium]|nr:imelysin family protein [Acidimicrobiia bacterium]
MRWPAVILVALTVAACSASGGSVSSAPPTTVEGEADRRTALDQINDEVIIPAYGVLADSATDLVEATNMLCQQPSQDSLAEARAAWGAAWLAWLRTTAHSARVDEMRLEASFTFAPDIEGVEALLAGTDPVSVEAIRQLGADQRGLRAIEWLLFGPGSEALSGRAERRCQMAASASTVVEEAAATVLAALDDTQSEQRSQEELDDVVNDLIFAVQEVADRRLGIATGSTNDGIPAPGEAQGAAGIGAREAEAVIQGVAAVYEGGGKGGLSPLVAAGFAATDERVLTRMSDLSELLAALPASLEKADPADLAAAEEAARALHRTLSTEVVSVLGVTLMFGDTDGDS